MLQPSLFPVTSISVSELTRYLREWMESDELLRDVWVQGEITNLSRPASGHVYFTIKDEYSALKCVIWRTSAGRATSNLQSGLAVEVHGYVSVYERDGTYQLYVDAVRPAGEGTLFQEFLRLKARLEEEGLFDASRKKMIPQVPAKIGVVTSPSGAALQDILNTLQRRYPLVEVILAPAAVQGENAPGELAAAIGQLNRETGIDVIIVARGGGSLEDLWAFNDERVVRAVAASHVPIISGVGHETDFTIADFCADLRAPTPTAAAELVAQPRSVWLGALDLLQQRLADAMQRQLDARWQRLDQAAARLGRPSACAARAQLRLAQQAQRLRHAMLLYLQRLAHEGQALEADFVQQTRQRLAREHERLERLALRLELLDPQQVLQRGYALLSDASGHVLTSARAAHPGDAVRARLADGTLDLLVTAPH
jgi:exodeoxyribonuclease VII large subunit